MTELCLYLVKTWWPRLPLTRAAFLAAGLLFCWCGTGIGGLKECFDTCDRKIQDPGVTEDQIEACYQKCYRDHDDDMKGRESTLSEYDRCLIYCSGIHGNSDDARKAYQNCLGECERRRIESQAPAKKDQERKEESTPQEIVEPSPILPIRPLEPRASPPRVPYTPPPATGVALRSVTRALAGYVDADSTPPWELLKADLPLVQILTDEGQHLEVYVYGSKENVRNVELVYHARGEDWDIDRYFTFVRAFLAAIMLEQEAGQCVSRLRAGMDKLVQDPDAADVSEYEAYAWESRKTSCGRLSCEVVLCRYSPSVHPMVGRASLVVQVDLASAFPSR